MFTQPEVVSRRNTVILACLVELATAATVKVMQENGLAISDQDGKNRTMIAEGAAAHFNGHVSTRLGVES